MIPSNEISSAIRCDWSDLYKWGLVLIFQRENNVLQSVLGRSQRNFPYLVLAGTVGQVEIWLLSLVNVFVDIDFVNVDISNVLLVTSNLSYLPACDEGPGMFAHFLTAISLLLVAALLPFSLVFVVKVVQVHNENIWIFCLDQVNENQECKWGIQVYSL